MFETFEPSSFDSMKELLPTIGQVVTIEKCMYYLSLVEQIANLRNQFAEHLDALHARAEMRYEYWIDGCRKAIPGPLVAPPIDVAYIMHAHLVSPFRYYEDCVRLNLPMLPMPLKQIHMQQSQPTEPSLQFWKTCVPASEPYLLTLDDILGDILLKLPCHHCGCQLSITGLDYGHWRFHPMAFMTCWSCNAETNMHHKAMIHLANDIGQTKNHVRGTMINAIGQFKQVSIEKDICLMDADAYFDGHYSGQPRTTRQQHNIEEFKGVPERFLAVCRDKRRPRTNSMDEFEQYFGAKNKTEDELMRTVRWTYSNTNPSPFSLDLLQAVERQHVVGSRMLHVQWMLPDGLVRGLRNYKGFLLLMKNDPRLIGVPTLEIDVSWHTHQCHPVDYRRFTLKHIDRVINHDDTIPQYQLDIYSAHTRLAWHSKKKVNLIKQIGWRKKKDPDFGLDYVHGLLDVEERVYNCNCQHQGHHVKKDKHDSAMSVKNIQVTSQEYKTIVHTRNPGSLNDSCGTSNDDCSSIATPDNNPHLMKIHTNEVIPQYINGIS